MAELNVQLKADINKFIRALDKAEKALLDIDDAAEEAASSTVKVGNSSKKLTGNVANTTPTLLEFNRVIQDAPFGIQGVANNITQLTQNFGQLSQSAGGARAAFSALLGGLAGPAGILFAISAITSLLVQFGDELFKSADAAEDLADELERVNESFDAELALNEAIAKGLKLQGKSTEQINKDRIVILKNQLLSVDAILAENNALLATIKAQKESISLWEGLAGFLQTGFQNILNDIVRDITTVAAVAGVLAEETAKATGLQEKLAQFAKEDKKENQAIKDLQTEITNITTERQNILNSILETEKAITDEQKKQAGRAKQTKAELVITPQAAIPALGNFFVGTEEAVTTSQNNISKKQAQFLADLADFNDQASQLITQGFAQTIGNIGQSIGTAIAAGANVLKAVGGTLLQSIGQLLQALGRAAIQIGVGMLAIKFAFKNPFTAIAAGVAMVALGSAISSSVQGSLNQIGGGGSSGGSNFSGGGGGFTGGASPGGGSFDGGRVVFEISGTSLIGVLSRTANRNQRLGGGLSIG